jgi:hypothetical protein
VNQQSNGYFTPTVTAGAFNARQKRAEVRHAHTGAPDIEQYMSGVHRTSRRAQKSELQRSESNGIGDVAGAPDMSGVHRTVRCTIQQTALSAFRDRGVPKPTSECAACPSPDGSSAWASAKGGEARWPESGVREVEVPRPSCSSRAQVGCACSRGVTSVHAGEGSERPQESVCLILVPARPTFSKKALALPFIVVRRGSRCTMGGSRVLRV